MRKLFPEHIFGAVGGSIVGNDDFIRRSGIEHILFGDIPVATVRSNKEIVERKFSLEGYESRLRGIYQDLSGTSDTPGATADR